ncbi:hypothetical protein HYU22_04390 [Candidatus Woesearchaeota archaeon]|nr:hypothetical protein [Candidatus Woesearchaeota archaeon]
MANLAEARKQVWDCELRRTEIADIVYRLESPYDHGEKHNLNVLDRNTLFNFGAYKKALKLMTWRNRIQQHQPDGTEEMTVRKVFDEIVAEKNGEDPGQTSFTFSGMGIAAATDVDEEIIKYNSPWVLVGAGLEYAARMANGPRDFKRLLQYFGDLKIGFSMRRYETISEIQLLGKVLRLECRNDDFLIIHGFSHGPQTQLKRNGMYFYKSNIWKGKVSDFANAVLVIENAIRAVGVQPLKLHASGSEWYGLDLLFYETRRAHEVEQPLPERVIGRIRTVPGEDTIETIIQSGKEVVLDVEVVEDA